MGERRKTGRTDSPHASVGKINKLSPELVEEIGWTVVPREEAEARCGFDPQVPAKDRAKGASLFIDDLLDPKIGKIRTLRGAGWGLIY